MNHRKRYLEALGMSSQEVLLIVPNFDSFKDRVGLDTFPNGLELHGFSMGGPS